MNRSLVIAAAVTVGAVAWVMSGQVGGRPAAAPPPPATAVETPPMQVRVVVSQAAVRPEAVTLQGRTEPSRIVALKAELRGRIADLPVARGERVAAGTALVRFDAEDRLAGQVQARALVDQRRLEHEGAQALNRRGHATDVQLATAKALLDAALAQQSRADNDVDNLVIKAPFDGVLEKRDAELGDFLDLGKPAVTLVSLDPLRFVGFAAEKNLAGLRLGAAGEARLLTGEVIPAKLTFIAATAESATRTFRVELEAANPGHRLAGGLTAQIILPLPSHAAHFLPASALALADDGAVGVKTVEEGDVARFQPVEVLSMTADGVWLAGLPAQVRVIVVGQEFVAPGARVRPVEAGTNTGKSMN
jgi:membrane fusion protein, multidrug efflux system